MSEKRRDNRSRILHVGESQRPDGRYACKYKDLNGNVKFIYSWRLDKNEKTEKVVAALSKSWFIGEDRSNDKSVIRLPRQECKDFRNPLELQWIFELHPSDLHHLYTTRFVTISEP